ncbi:MAG: hypothetical protein EOP06_27990 [Proteobacteria bacterium]|nr:MAG: hypothetical protein EOP06_27990 [Pseudomonadota bacterium]
MKNALTSIVLLFVLAGCQSVSKDDVSAHINGYWQIEKVVTADGDDKDYQGNTVYDHFEIKNGTGLRTKVMPRLDGKFETNNLSETISVTHDDNGTFLNYATDYAKWKEEVKAISDEELVLVNDRNIEYHYKKAGPINMLDDGKATE